MEVPSEENEIPIPLNSTYGHAHMMHHHDHPSAIVPCSAGPHIPIDEEHHVPSKKTNVRYRECLKNHAAGMGGNATDGCGEFMASGDDGTLEALTCSACSCHRNFHRKEIEGDPDTCRTGRKLFVGHHKGYLGPDHHHPGLGPHHIRAVGPHPMIMSYSMAAGAAAGASDQSDDQDGGPRPPHQKKRFRTKFTPEQKEKMLNFAEKVGWKIQKQEEGVVQQFCNEVGVKRRVLKVWMHNNKHTLAKKNIHSDPQNQLSH